VWLVLHHTPPLGPPLPGDLGRPMLNADAASTALAGVGMAGSGFAAASGMAAGAARGGATLAGSATAAYRAGGASGVATSGLAKGADAVMSPLRRAAGSLKSSFEGSGSRAATGEGSLAGTDAVLRQRMTEDMQRARGKRSTYRTASWPPMPLLSTSITRPGYLDRKASSNRCGKGMTCATAAPRPHPDRRSVAKASLGLWLKTDRAILI
jgi:hypothetical protein